jgi:hypothetical protein
MSQQELLKKVARVLSDLGIDYMVSRLCLSGLKSRQRDYDVGSGSPSPIRYPVV